MIVSPHPVITKPPMLPMIFDPPAIAEVSLASFRAIVPIPYGSPLKHSLHLGHPTAFSIPVPVLEIDQVWKMNEESFDPFHVPQWSYDIGTVLQHFAFMEFKAITAPKRDIVVTLIHLRKPSCKDEVKGQTGAV
jgi:hypothetical protein